MENVRKVVDVYARLEHNGCDFRVNPDGEVFFWVKLEYEWHPYWPEHSDYNEIQRAGLEVLK